MIISLSLCHCNDDRSLIRDLRDLSFGSLKTDLRIDESVFWTGILSLGRHTFDRDFSILCRNFPSSFDTNLWNQLRLGYRTRSGFLGLRNWSRNQNTELSSSSKLVQLENLRLILQLLGEHLASFVLFAHCGLFGRFSHKDID